MSLSCESSRAAARLGLALWLLSGMASAAAWAASVPSSTAVEVEAAVAAGADALPGAPARERVVARALEMAVAEVAGRYLTDPSELEPLARIGGTPRDFVLRYRVMERIGERDTLILLDQAPPPAREYAARIQVHVDTPRLTNALAAVGLWQQDVADGGTRSYWIEAPLQWSSWVRFRRALLMAGAERVVPSEISDAGMQISVDGGRGAPASILARVVADPPEGMEVELLVRGDAPRVRLHLLEPESPAQDPLD